MDKYVERINMEAENDVRKEEQITGIVKTIFVVIICILLILAAKFGIEYQEENYYNIVCLNGIEYSSTDHDIEIYDDQCVIVDGKEYGWSYVNYINLHIKKGDK